MEKKLTINEMRAIVNDKKNNALFPCFISDRAIKCHVFFKQELVAQIETWKKSLAAYDWKYDEFLDAAMVEIAKETR